MKTATLEPPLLHTGERLTRDEFIERWEMQPALNFAELIGGIVFLRMPMCEEHGGVHVPLTMWIGGYEMDTLGCMTNINSSWYMRDDMPQPENSMRLLPEYGGQSTLLKRKGRHYLVGAPEFIAEVSLSTRAYDAKTKRELYRKAGVLEYLNVQSEKNKVVWLRLKQAEYVELKSLDGILRSEAFPGLWLDPKALLKNDKARVMAVLREGLNSAEHKAFVAKLAARKRG